MLVCLQAPGRTYLRLVSLKFLVFCCLFALTADWQQEGHTADVSKAVGDFGGFLIIFLFSVTIQTAASTRLCTEAVSKALKPADEKGTLDKKAAEGISISLILQEHRLSDATPISHYTWCRFGVAIWGSWSLLNLLMVSRGSYKFTSTWPIIILAAATSSIFALTAYTERTMPNWCTPHRRYVPCVSNMSL
jgi:hypothetical protein